MAAVRGGLGREQAHALIQKHSLAVADDLRNGRCSTNDLLARLGAEPSLRRSASAPARLVGSPLDLVGTAVPQVQAFAARVEAVVQRHPAARAYEPGRLL